MANKKIRIRPEGINNYVDVLHPETSADNIIGQGLFGTTTGTNAYVVSMPSVIALYAGLRVTVKFSVSNTGASTLNVSGLGAKPIVKAGGSALTSGNLKASGVYTLVYDGTSFQLQGEGGSGNATASDLLSGKTASTDAGNIVGTLALTGDAIAGNVLSAKTFYSNNPSTKLTGTIPSKATATITPGTTNQTIASGQFLSGIQTISGDANLVSSNIRSGVSIFGKAGSHIFSFIPGINTFAQTSTISVSRKGTTPTELYGIAVYHSGTIRTKFSLRTSSTGYTAYGRIYVNGVAKGVIRSTTSTNSVDLIEDISVWANDVVSLYVWVSDSTNYAYSYGMSLSMGYSMPFFTNYPV